MITLVLDGRCVGSVDLIIVKVCQCDACSLIYE